MLGGAERSHWAPGRLSQNEYFVPFSCWLLLKHNKTHLWLLIPSLAPLLRKTLWKTQTAHTLNVRHILRLCHYGCMAKFGSQGKCYCIFVIWTEKSGGAKAEHGYSQDQMVFNRKPVILNLPKSLLQASSLLNGLVPLKSLGRSGGWVD